MFFGDKIYHLILQNDSSEEQIFFRYKDFFHVFTNIKRVSIKKPNKRSATQVGLKGRDIFVNIRGARQIILKSKLSNSEQLEEMFIENLFKYKYNIEGYENFNIIDHIDQSEQSPFEKSKPKKVVKRKVVKKKVIKKNKTMNEEKTLTSDDEEKTLTSEDEEKTEDEEKLEEEPADEEKPEEEPADEEKLEEKPADEENEEKTSEGTEDEETFNVVILKKESLESNDYIVKSLTEECIAKIKYPIIYKSTSDVLSILKSRVKNLNTKYGQTVIKLEKHRFSIYPPFTQLKLLKLL